jgi:hypothetical protein
VILLGVTTRLSAGPHRTDDWRRASGSAAIEFPFMRSLSALRFSIRAVTKWPAENIGAIKLTAVLNDSPG